MHREYHPDDMEHLRAHAFEDERTSAAAEHDHDREHRSLYALTTLLGVLIGADVLLWALGMESWRAPLGVPLMLIAALIGSARIIYGALEALAHGKVGADVALALASTAALVLGEYFVAAEVVFIALVGEVLEAITANRAMRSIRRLFDQSPRTARVRRDGVEVEIPAHQVELGDVVIVRAGERVPVDGPVLAGRSTVDQAALTGESVPVDKGPGEAVFTGTINQFGTLEIRAEKVGHDTTFGQVLRLVADAQRRKAPLHRTADRLARHFLPVVLGVAFLTVLAGYTLGWTDTWMRAVAVLVVACPCALILATPAAVMASLAWLARNGVVAKGGIAIERLAGCDTFAFDKTGTLTLGCPELASVVPLAGWDEVGLLQLASTAEQASKHPLAEVIVRSAAERGIEPFPASDVQTLPGAGMSVRWHLEGEEDEGRSLLVGNRRLLAEHGVELNEEAEAALQLLDDRGETPLLVVDDGQIVGLIGVRDTVRPEAHDVIHDLKHLHIKEFALLTGDRPRAAAIVAKRVHIKTVESELLPADKARWVRDRQAEGRRVAMVGDGINDAPALAQADVGIALAGVGSDLAAEAGDLVILGDPLRVLPGLLKLSRQTVAIIRQNIIGFAFILNAGAIALAVLGILGPVAAAILHQAGSLLVLLNSMRLLGFGGWGQTPPARWVRSIGRTIRDWDDRFDPGHAFDQLLLRWRWFVALGILAYFGSYASRNWAAIGPDEVGLLQRQGRFAGVLEPGLHLRLPPPFETITRLQPGKVRALEIGFREAASRNDHGSIGWGDSHDRGAWLIAEEESLLLTGDGQLVELTATVQYRLDPRPEALRAYAFGTANADEALRPLAELAVRAVASRRRLDAILTAPRQEAERAVTADLRQRVERYGLGIAIVGVAFQDVHPPLAVLDAYRDVSRAEQEKQARINRGLAYQAEQRADGLGQSNAHLQAAEADRESQVTRASGETDAFRALQETRASAPALTDHQLYWDAIASALAGKNKVLLDPEQAGRRRHLIVPDFPIDAGSNAVQAAIEASEKSVND
ncbi:hypothetical protein BH23PLA1_BH23PLA1_15300 [soil metagenome]